MLARRLRLTLFSSLAVTLAATLAACGGGGGSSSSTPPVTGGSSVPSTSPSTAPSSVPTTAPALAGSAAILGTPVANGTVVYSCGCTAQAGTTATAANGTYTIAPSATAIPASPSPTYTTVPGRNYVQIVSAGSGAQTWTMNFLGNSAGTTRGLNTGATDEFSTAVALYAYYFANTSNNSDLSFDLWNFPSLATFYNTLKTSPNGAESTLISDIRAAQGASRSLYPVAPQWQPSISSNGTIASDLVAVKASGDATLPKQCASSADSSCPGLSP